MAKDSKIEWTTHTQNYWVGCTEVSPACDFCYAKSWAKRAGRPHLWEGKLERTKDWSGPAKWNAAAAAAGRIDKVFSNSLSDFFDNQADPEWRDDAWYEIKNTPSLIHMLLTKRPQNIPKMLPADWGDKGYPNVWLGTTVENQQEAERRISPILAVPARMRFLSCEPLLGPVSLKGIRPDAIGLVIAGGEDYARKGRIPDLQWFRDMREECAAGGVAFFMKQIHKNTPIPPDLMVRQMPKSPSPETSTP